MARFQHLRVPDLPRQVLLDGTWQRTAVRGDESLITFNWMDPAMPPQAPHDHPFDQVSLVTEGTMRFVVDGESIVVRAGDVVVIPAGVPHTGVAIGDGPALNIDVYAPPREDYLHLTEHQGARPPAAPSATAERSATRLLTDWAAAFDAGRAVDAANLLTEDAVLEGLLPEPVGPEGFRRWAEERDAGTDRRTQHHVTNIRFGPLVGEELPCSAYVTVYAVSGSAPTPTAVFVGRYDDTIRLTPDGPRFARRVIRALRPSGD